MEKNIKTTNFPSFRLTSTTARPAHDNLHKQMMKLGDVFWPHKHLQGSTIGHMNNIDCFSSLKCMNSIWVVNYYFNLLVKGQVDSSSGNPSRYSPRAIKQDENVVWEYD